MNGGCVRHWSVHRTREEPKGSTKVGGIGVTEALPGCTQKANREEANGREFGGYHG